MSIICRSKEIKLLEQILVSKKTILFGRSLRRRVASFLMLLALIILFFRSIMYHIARKTHLIIDPSNMSTAPSQLFD